MFPKPPASNQATLKELIFYQEVVSEVSFCLLNIVVLQSSILKVALQCL